jgi:hypothetical protein
MSDCLRSLLKNYCAANTALRNDLKMRWDKIRLLRCRSFMKQSREVGKHCLSPQGELRSRPIASSNFGNPAGAAQQGPPSLGHFSWRSKNSDQPPGCPRQIKHSA